MFILSYVSSGLEFLQVYHTSIYENSELKVFESIKFFGQVFNNWFIRNKYIQDSWILLIIVVNNITVY